MKKNNGDLFLSFNRVMTNKGKQVILENGSFLDLMEALEKACSPVGFSKCSAPHFYVEDLATKEKMNIWVENGSIGVGNDAAFQARIDANK